VTDPNESPETDESDDGSPESTDRAAEGDPLVARLRGELDALDDTAAGMLRQYREGGPMEPQDAHAAAGGSGDRGPAYATNRRLRKRGFVSHVGCGQYDYALAESVRSELTDPTAFGETPSDESVAEVLAAIEAGSDAETAEPEGSNEADPDRPTVGL